MGEEFTKDHIKKFGARGAPVYEQEKSKTDLDDLTTRVVETGHPFCTCGAPISAVTDAPPAVYRCTRCELISCQRCVIRMRRQSLCPTCARREYVDKRTFLALTFLDKGVMEPDDLVTVETVGDEPVEVTIDPATNPLFENDYLTDDGQLSYKGQEAAAVGRQLYGDDADIQAVMGQLRIQEVVNR
ncbi:hypothetical protein [Natrinema sp. 1APR25-10V2]|uniref:hypothetical protein n=1 Tax=Natrinema sp. 1APR25-10V2 TaxID=2951081 RepID=UPI0028745026|nr:hypothetical protein [Natrinema sp. 1APR25-10V2]MDS0476812.1 hypothetical protein [Natrinema sp. 1APR25-10V2]